MRKDIPREKYEALQEKYGNERVYAVPFHFTGIVQDGFTPWDKTSTAKDVFTAVLPHGKFIERADAEGCIEFVQAIPYILVTNSKGEYFVSRRLEGEQRLKGKLSLGFGGHINPCDDYRAGVQAMILAGAERELNEELNYDEIPAKQMKLREYGLVRDLKSTTPDHFGVVYKLEIQEAECDKLRIREKETLEGVWMSQLELLRNFERFESWAQLILSHDLSSVASKIATNHAAA